MKAYVFDTRESLVLSRPFGPEECIIALGLPVFI